MTLPRARRWLAYVLGTLVLLAAGLVWLARGETALGWAARWAERASGGQLVIQAPRGSLLGPLGADRLTLENDFRRIVVRGLELDWRPRALWDRRLAVTRLTAAEVLVEEIRPDPEPLRLPDSLKLPVSLALPRVEVGRLTLVQAGRRIELNDLRLSLGKPADRYRLELRQVHTPWGQVGGRLDLADSRPYALTARALLDSPGKHRLTATASGDLGRVLLQAEAQAQAAGQLNLNARAVLTPFAPLPLESARVTAAGINPRQWQPDWPRAELSVEADFTLAEGGRLLGRARVANGQPGGLDRDLLPLARLTGAFAGQLRDGQAEVDLSDLLLDLGWGGQLRGDGRYAGQRLDLNLSTANLDPRALHGRLRSLRLAGRLELSAGEADQHLRARLTHGGYALDLDARHADARLSIASARLAAAGGSLSASGHLELTGVQAFELSGRLQRFDPARFGDFPAADLNADLRARGRLAPKASGELRFSLAPSRFRGQPLAGDGRLLLAPDRLADSRVRLQLAENRLDFQGAFGRPGDRLTWRLNAPRLARISPDFQGSLAGSGELGGSLAQPQVRFQARGQGLAWPGGWSLASLEASGRLDKGLDGPLAVDARLDGLKGDGLELEAASLSGQGSRAEHRLSFSARGGLLDARGVLAGGWGEGVWSGRLLELANQGRHALRLHAPAGLSLARDRVQLGTAALDYAGARITLQSLDWRPGQLASRGAFSDLHAATLADLWRLSRDWRGTLRLRGDWDLNLGDTANGMVRISRQRGDLVMLTDPETSLGLDGLALSVTVLDARLEADLQATGATLGTLGVQAGSRLSRQQGAWGLAGDAPLSGEVVFGLPSLAWLGPILDRSGSLVLAGAASARLDLGGSVAQPRVSGDLAGEGLRLDWPAVGLQFRDGSVHAHLENDQLQLSRFFARAGQGQLTARGSAAWRGAQPGVDLTWQADQLQALSRPDRQLVVSGAGRVAIEGRQARLEGRLKADRALIVLPKADVPTRSDDVVVLGRTDAAARATPLTLALDLNLDLGDSFILQGRGLDAQLAGGLRVKAAPRGQPRVTGTVRVARGSYSAYGQRLTIERGLVDFQGPLDNPGLDILAMRRNQDVAAGVALTGTALAPRARLVSEPAVPDTEKLAWLVLGRGTETASSVDLNLLTTAASAILSAGESVSLQARLAQRTGLDEVGLKGGGELENTVLALGKRLSSKAYLTYEQGLTGVGNLVKLNYTLSQRWSVQAHTGRETAVDLFYTLGFD